MYVVFSSVEITQPDAMLIRSYTTKEAYDDILTRTMNVMQGKDNHAHDYIALLVDMYKQIGSDDSVFVYRIFDDELLTMCKIQGCTYYEE